MDISRDPRLGPLFDLRKEYLSNPFAKKEIDVVFASLAQPTELLCNSPPKTPSKITNELAFNSPLPLKASTRALKSGSQMMQETPIRKVQFGNASTLVQDCSLPANVDYERDPVFAKIINSEPLRRAVLNAQRGLKPQVVTLSAPLALSDSRIADTDLSGLTKETLQSLGVSFNDVLQSAVLNAPFYERLFTDLKEKDIDYASCKQLRPLELVGKELRSNRPLYEEVREYVTALPNSLDVAYTPVNIGLQQQHALSISKSTDSGFDSKPATPSHTANPIAYHDDLNAQSGKLFAIPGIQEMNMYPIVEASKNRLPANMQSLTLNEQPLQRNQSKYLTYIYLVCVYLLFTAN